MKKNLPYRDPGFLVASFLVAALLILQIADRSRLSAGPERLDASLKEIEVFAEAYRVILDDYADTTKIIPAELIANAIRGMLSNLDPHSQYRSPEETRELMSATEGEFGGIGIHIGSEKGRLTVIAPVEGTPAWKGGVEAGDVIVTIDGRASDTMSLDIAVSILRGRPGTAVTIEVERFGFARPISIRLIREMIRVPSVRQTTIRNLGYIRLSTFTERTAEELDEALTALDRARARGLILDLRDNPGGVLTGAIAVANRFLDSGVIVSTVSRDPSQTVVHRASAGGLITRLPIVVLVNANSASASEIVAGAIQDHRRGVIIGDTSYGKGSVQTVEKLPDGAAITLTTARYFTPSGRSIHGVGIAPNSGMEISMPTISDSDLAALRAMNESPDTDLLREFARHHKSYDQADIDRLAEALATAGITLSRETIERRLLIELARRNDNRLYLEPRLDPPLRRAIELLGASQKLEPSPARK
jgi:carboxyl-terminal processing protease